MLWLCLWPPLCPFGVPTEHKFLSRLRLFSCGSQVRTGIDIDHDSAVSLNRSISAEAYQQKHICFCPAFVLSSTHLSGAKKQLQFLTLLCLTRTKPFQFQAIHKRTLCTHSALVLLNAYIFLFWTLLQD